MKTAGTTFAIQLSWQFPGAAMYPARGFDWDDPNDVAAYVSIPRLLSLPVERRQQIEMYSGHFPHMVCKLVDPDLVTLTLLRDPTERIVSILKQLKRLKEWYQPLSLEAIYDDNQATHFYLNNHQTKVFAVEPADGITNILRAPMEIDADRLARAKERLATVDVLGITERYAEFIEELRTRFGWWPDGLDVTNRGNVSEEPWELSPSFRDRIAEENRFDVELYEYAQSLVEQRHAAGAAGEHGG